jgi:sulfur carrier protein ThiS
MVTLRIPMRVLSEPLPESIHVIKFEGGEIFLNVPSGQSTMHTINYLGIKLAQPVITIVNSEACDIEQILEPGDEVRLVPQISGG